VTTPGTDQVFPEQLSTARTPAERERLDWLTGLRSSKPTYYAEYRHTADGLDRAIRGLEAVSSALCTTAQGSSVVAPEVLRTVTAVFDGASAALLLVDGAALPGAPGLIGQRPDGSLTTSAAELPGRLADTVAGLGTDATVPGNRLERSNVLVAPLLLAGRAVGFLLACLPGSRCADDTDASILSTLANQAVVALHNGWLYEESERLRGRANELHDEAEFRAREIARRNEQLERFGLRLAEARERQVLNAERTRIARELHDSVVQLVLGIGLNVEWCRSSLAEGQLKDRLLLAKELAREAVERIRGAIFELSTAEEASGTGLVEKLTRLCDTGTELAGHPVTFQLRGPVRAIDRPLETAVFQIAQSAVFNVALHARASHAEAELVYRPRTLRLAVHDDGIGDAAAIRGSLAAAELSCDQGRHRGLANMAARARSVGGRLRITASRPTGVRVALTVGAEDYRP
jgi:signal transduction histidine kinase